MGSPPYANDKNNTFKKLFPMALLSHTTELNEKNNANENGVVITD